MEDVRGDRELPAKVRATMRRAADQWAKMRAAAGGSLVALLCAGAFAPLLTSSDASGTVALAWMGIAGNVGAEALAGMAMQAIDMVRGDGVDGAEDGEGAEDEVGAEGGAGDGVDLGEVLREAAGHLREQNVILAEIRDSIRLLQRQPQAQLQPQSQPQPQFQPQFRCPAQPALGPAPGVKLEVMFEVKLGVEPGEAEVAGTDSPVVPVVGADAEADGASEPG
jgi:hypothetical protein